MKIGFSFGRCVRDIVNGDVALDDVLCIIARTYMPKEDDVLHVIEHYMYERSYLMGLDKDKCEQVGLELFRSGRILEPRANGIAVMQVPREFVWMDLYPTVAATKNEGVKQAWESYRMLIGLAEQLPESGEDAVYKHGDKMIHKEPTPEEMEEQKKALDLLIRHMV